MPGGVATGPLMPAGVNLQLLSQAALAVAWWKLALLPALALAGLRVACSNNRNTLACNATRHETRALGPSCIYACWALGPSCIYACWARTPANACKILLLHVAAFRLIRLLTRLHRLLGIGNTFPQHLR